MSSREASASKSNIKTVKPQIGSVGVSCSMTLDVPMVRPGVMAMAIKLVLRELDTKTEFVPRVSYFQIWL